MEVKCYELNAVNEEELQYAVIVARYKGAFIFVKHKKRETWEVPGGKRESGESIESTAKRELFEETGAFRFDVVPLFQYSVTRKMGEESFGCVYFAEVSDIKRPSRGK